MKKLLDSQTVFPPWSDASWQGSAKVLFLDASLGRKIGEVQGQRTGLRNWPLDRGKTLKNFKRRGACPLRFLGAKRKTRALVPIGESLKKGKIESRKSA